MCGWAEGALREAIEMVARLGRNDVASDLNRILNLVAFSDLDIMRSGEADEIANDIIEATSVSDLTEAIWRIVRMASVSHCTLHLVSACSTANFSTRVITTYPDEWITLYLNRRYVFIDPVIQACKSRTLSFFWDMLPSPSTITRQFWRDAEAHGLGSSGYTLPLQNDHGDIIALTLCSTSDAATFRDLIAFHESDLFNLGVLLAAAYTRLASEQMPVAVNPTDDQLMVLHAVTVGADEADLEKRTYQFGSYSTIKRSICLLFRTRTVAQAAVLAARLGLLDSLPLTRADVLAASSRSSSLAMHSSVLDLPGQL